MKKTITIPLSQLKWYEDGGYILRGYSEYSGEFPKYAEVYLPEKDEDDEKEKQLNKGII